MLTYIFPSSSDDLKYAKLLDLPGYRDHYQNYLGGSAQKRGFLTGQAQRVLAEVARTGVTRG
jgi:hypothetical protein